MWEVWEDGEEVLPPHTPHTPLPLKPTLCVRNPQSPIRAKFAQTIYLYENILS